jgi:uncharacterized membrane protein YciS (DUF1049 family)
MGILILALCLLFFGAIVFLMTLNGSPVDVDVFLHTFRQIPLSQVMVISLLAGITFAGLLSLLDGIRLRMLNHRLRRQVGRLELEIQRRTSPTPAVQPVTPATRPPLDYPRT